jgi:hypothetical protein
MRYAIPKDATVHTPVGRIMCSTSVVAMQLAYLVAAFAVVLYLRILTNVFAFGLSLPEVKAMALPTNVREAGVQVHEKRHHRRRNPERRA